MSTYTVTQSLKHHGRPQCSAIECKVPFVTLHTSSPYAVVSNAYHFSHFLDYFERYIECSGQARGGKASGMRSMGQRLQQGELCSCSPFLLCQPADRRYKLP